MPPDEGSYSDDQRPPLDGVDEQTIIAKQEELAAPGPSARLTKILREQEVASRPNELKLSDAAYRSVKDFERDTAALNKQVSAELDYLNAKWDSPLKLDLDLISPEVREGRILHVYGPDVHGTGEPKYYKLGWVHLDWGQAGADPRTGKLFASNYTTGPARFTVAQIGVKLRPTFPMCRLSVRAYTQFSGFDALHHRVHDPSLPEQRRAWALGSVGVKVDSWNLDGTGYFQDGLKWVDVWNRSEVNPSDSRQYENSVSSGDGLMVELLATNSRDYAIWVTCLVGVSADPGFAVSTYATSSIGCDVPFFVVEEIERL